RSSAGISCAGNDHRLTRFAAQTLAYSQTIRGGYLSGRASRLHRDSADFLTLSRLDLSCSTLGKSSNRRDLAYAQIMPKIFHEWIKQWIKVDRLSVLMRSVHQSPRFIHFIPRPARAQDRARSKPLLPRAPI